jgi:peptidoglycan/xylan/chitin deacetylase (PgdA/CDA1 family)
LIAVWVRRAALLSILVGATPSAFAGPQVIPHRSLWPDSINSTAEFDRASRAEILVFAQALADSETLDDNALKAWLDVHHDIDDASLQRVRLKLWKLLSQNYQLAARGCVADEAFCPTNSDTGDLRREAAALSTNLQPRYGLWFNDAAQFHRYYLSELLRLAAVFARYNSEVDTFNDGELQGWAMPDRHFLLTFDDGPTRGPGHPEPNAEDTDLVLQMLRDHQVNAVFFALGGTFQARLSESSVEAMRTLYSGMCVGSHGWVHKSHATLPQWQDSIASSSKLIRETLPESYVPLFRPPYGQRPPDSGPFFQLLGLKVALWNIDAHDWDDALTADDVEQRVMTLMLLWRRGFVLFHDVHARSRAVVPHLISWLAHDDVAWINCHQIDWAGSGDLLAAAPAPAKQ